MTQINETVDIKELERYLKAVEFQMEVMPICKKYGMTFFPTLERDLDTLNRQVWRPTMFVAEEEESNREAREKLLIETKSLIEHNILSKTKGAKRTKKPKTNSTLLN